MALSRPGAVLTLKKQRQPSASSGNLWLGTGEQKWVHHFSTRLYTPGLQKLGGKMALEDDVYFWCKNNSKSVQSFSSYAFSEDPDIMKEVRIHVVRASHSMEVSGKHWRAFQWIEAASCVFSPICHKKSLCMIFFLINETWTANLMKNLKCLRSAGLAPGCCLCLDIFKVVHELFLLSRTQHWMKWVIYCLLARNSLKSLSDKKDETDSHPHP